MDGSFPATPTSAMVAEWANEMYCNAVTAFRPAVPSSEPREHERRHSSGDRILAIDVVRGYCIISMVAGHLAGGSSFSRAVHIFPRFDGASGFVLLSGLVLGIVQRRRTHRVNLAGVLRKTGTRIAVIYVAQMALVLIGVAMLLLGRRRHANIPPTQGRDVAELIVSALTMSLAPPVGSVLRLYVILLLLAMGAYWLLMRGEWGAVLAASFGLYGLGMLVREHTSFVAFDGVTRGANWAMWQLLFISALVLGWQWERIKAADILRRRRWWVLLGYPLVFVVLSGVGRRFWLAEKIDFSLPRMLVAYVTLAFLYVAVEQLSRLVPRAVTRPVELIGQRSLDSYIIQACVATVVPSYVAFGPDSTTALLLAVGVLAMCWAWAALRSRHKRGLAAAA